jgi:anti-sigma regulatory factor (Ser/Thr protein kinase)
LIRLSQSIVISDPSEIAPARRLAALCASTLGLSETASGRAALVATEVGTNLLKHAGGGSILFGSTTDPEPCVVIVGLDRGRGITNVRQAMEDGFSTAGSPGTGLGAIDRNATLVDLYTRPDGGTAILCEIGEGTEPRRPRAERMMVAAGVCIPKNGEDVPGDAWVAIPGQAQFTVAVADGLGHGPLAATASTAAVRAIAEGADRSLEAVFQDSHAALRPTRGAAIGIARLHQGHVEFMGVGNIAGTIYGDDATRRMVSLPGIVGHEMRRLQSFSYPWTEDSLLVLASDGISTSFNVPADAGLRQRHPALIAAVLFRDHCRGSDDATVVVVKAAA